MSSPSLKLSGHERRVSALLGAVVGVRMLGLFMLLPVFVVSGERYAGATPFLLGVALSIYGLAQAALQIPFGVLSDKYGRRRMLVAGLSLFVAGGVLAVFAETIGELIVARVVQGSGAVGTVALACIADHVRADRRAKANIFIGLGIGLAFFIGLIGGPIVVGAAGMDGVFVLTAILGATALALVWFKLPAGGERERPERAAHAESPFAALRNGELRVFFVGAFFLHAMMTSCFMLLPESLSEAMGRDGHWRFYAPVLSLSFVLSFLLLGRRRTVGGHRTPLALVALCGLSEAALPFVAGNLALVGLCMTAFFFAFNLLEAMLPARIGAACPPDGKGAAMGMFSTGQFLGVFAGGVISGWSMGVWNEYAISVIALSASGAWLIAMLKPSGRRGGVYN